MITRRNTKILIFLVIFVFTFILRAHNYDRTPSVEHLDEMLYAWSGLYLIEEGVPVSWSTLEYPESAQVYEGKISYKGGPPETSVKLYKPWLDEPPLFSLIVGYFAHFYGADRHEFIPSSYIRMPAIFLAALTSIMIFLITRLVSGFWMASLAMLTYGTVPIMVFGSRNALPENLITLCLVTIVYLLIKFGTQSRFLYLLPIPFLTGLAGLSKPTGFLLIFFALFFVFKNLYKSKQMHSILKYSLYLVIATIPFIVFYFVYGLHFDPEIFWKINSIQAFRPVGFASLTWFFISPAFETSYILKDGWYIFCLLAAMYFLFTIKEGLKSVVVIAFVFWVLVVMISGGEGDLLPWYRYPAFPFMAIMGAWGIQILIQRANFYTTFLAAGLLLSSRSLLVNPFRPNITPGYFRVVLSLILLPSLANLVFNNNHLARLSRLVVMLVVILGLYLNVIFVYNHFEIICENRSCPLVPGTFLSRLYFPLVWRLFVIDSSP